MNDVRDDLQRYKCENRDLENELRGQTTFLAGLSARSFLMLRNSDPNHGAESSSSGPEGFRDHYNDRSATPRTLYPDERT